MIRALAVLTLASGALGQNLRASSFQSFSSSVMGSDGQFHSKTHKVITETSNDGLEKKVSETLCKDGNCHQHVTFMGQVPAFMSSMAPRMPRMPDLPMMPDMRQHMAVMMDRMQRMQHHMRPYMQNMQHYMPPMQRIHFLAPRGQETVEVMVPMERIMTDAPVAMSAPLPRHASAGGFSDVLLVGVCGALIAAAFAIVMFLRTVLGGKAQAREMPLQALGQPLAPEAQAEQGLAMGTQAFVGAKLPLRAYLQDLYNRAGAPRTEAELAVVLLGDIYKNAIQKAVAAQV